MAALWDVIAVAQDIVRSSGVRRKPFADELRYGPTLVSIIRLRSGGLYTHAPGGYKLKRLLTILAVT